jgi:hypothetical protein
MSDWLAIGDETGNWDELHNPGAFLGVALVMGRIADWQGALEETLDGQRIQDRLQAPPQHLPASPPISSSSRGKPDRREVKVVAFVASGGARADPG